MCCFELNVSHLIEKKILQKKPLNQKLSLNVFYLMAIEQAIGVWYGFEIFMHNGNMGNDDALNPCILVELSDATYEVSRHRLTWQSGRLISHLEEL